VSLFKAKFSLLTTFPISLKDPKILLIGGGNVSLHKAKILLQNKIDFSIISNNFLQEFDEIDVTKKVKTFSKDDLQNYNVVVNATGDKEVSDILTGEKKRRFLLVNDASNQEVCDFYFNGVLDYGKLKISISSSGSSPTVTKKVKQKIKKIIPKKIETLCDDLYKERLNGIINKEKASEKIDKLLNPIYLIGCGLGDTELLTIKAYRIIQSLDVVLYDNLITEEILNIMSEKTEKIFVGKSKNNHSLIQSEINELILKYAKDGKKIARLKSGDPYIFGRGYEEYSFLTSHGFNVEVINGISSAIAGANFAGIPLTHRGASNSFSVVSSHLKDGELNLYWLDLLKREKHTTVVLMGLSHANEIQKRALQVGINKEYKVAIISNASRENQLIIKTTLDKLYENSQKAVSPSILVFGEVVGLGEI
jgi:uroporphyrin-III C-methyltransferase/precorrin-2 dehydrogenase/sirohydrochlorin ferrochelatase